MKIPMPCWMTATGSLRSQDSSMDVVMQYKTIISTIRTEEPMSFWSKSKIVSLRQGMVWKECQKSGLECQRWTSEKQIVLLVPFCVSFWSCLNRKNGSEIFPEQNNLFFPVCNWNTGHQPSICVCRCCGKRETGRVAQDPYSAVTIL